MRVSGTGSLLAGLIAFSATTTARAGEPARVESKARAAEDCGPLALYALLKLEGRTTDPDQVLSRFPPPRPGGYSMKELRDAARALGLGLDGVFLGKDGAAIDRPVIAFLKVEGRGHFLVVRPVGHSGRLVQVIDSNQPPHVMDRTDLVGSGQWTGLVLAPTRTSPTALIVAGVVVASVVGGSTRVLALRRAGARATFAPNS